jgi:hypothetical protein
MNACEDGVICHVLRGWSHVSAVYIAGRTKHTAVAAGQDQLSPRITKEALATEALKPGSKRYRGHVGILVHFITNLFIGEVILSSRGFLCRLHQQMQGPGALMRGDGGGGAVEPGFNETPSNAASQASLCATSLQG